MYYVYVLLCENGSLYTGITRNIEERFLDHAAGKGAKYTRANRPSKVIYSERRRNKSYALKREYQIKKMSRREKLALANLA